MSLQRTGWKTWLLPVLVVVLSAGVVVVGQNFYGQWDDKYPGNKVPPHCPPDSPIYPCYEPPFWPYDPIKVEMKDIGFVIGRSMSYAEYKYINWFLGVPYGKPPVEKRRFMPPESPGPGWDLGIREWDASYYRPACPQEIWTLDKMFMEPRNISEDCLYLNIFRPNLTDRTWERNRNYPVLVFIDGEDYSTGDGQLWPGHIVAEKEVLVVTMSYRLGALGFLSTLDSNAPGNYGIYDILKVLDFIRLYIGEFGGDPDRVTIAGHGSGAGIVGLLLVSPMSYLDGYRPLFHRAILMSGSDLCEWAVVRQVYNVNAREYAKLLGAAVGCDPYYGIPLDKMVDCLRYKHFEDIINATTTVYKAYGSLAGPFGPVVDGEYGVLPKDPKVLREEGKQMKIQILAGLNKDEGSFIVQNITKDIIGLNLEEGMDPGTFREIIYRMINARSATIRNVEEVVDAIEFEYTFWAKPDNMTAVLQNLVDLWSDMMWGWCVDATLKYHADTNYDGMDASPTVFMYIFGHRSEYEVLPHWMGVPHGKDAEYLFGYPFFNDTLGNITGIIPNQWEYTYIDRNISDFVQDMWVNFTQYGEPTVQWTRNVSWFPLSLQNLSFLQIQEYSFMDINYRQNHYGFWKEYFPSLSSQWPITTTPGPTPRPLVEFQVATYTMMGVALIIIFVIVSLAITLWRRRKAPDDADYLYK